MTEPEPTTPDQGRLEALESRVEAALQQVKPHLRGWLHAAMTPIALVAGIILVVLATTTEGKVSAAVFAGTAVLLFGTSAVYHRGTWSPRVGGVLRRLDHSNIFLIIAGSYTPVRAAAARRPGPHDAPHRVERRRARRALPGLLEPRPALALRPRLPDARLGRGLLLRPARSTTPAPRSWPGSSSAGCSTASGRSSTARSGRTSRPRWFGFHEVFHALTVLAFGAHFVAASIALTGHAT